MKPINRQLVTISLLTVLSFALFSCENEIEFKGNEVKSLLVLNSILTEDSSIQVYLSGSRFFLSDEETFRIIENAKVQVWKGDEAIETLQYTKNNYNINESYYTGNYRLKSGDRIRITATAPGLDPVECETEIIAPPAILSVDTVCTFFELSFFEGNPIYYSPSKANAGDESDYYTYSFNESYNLSIKIDDPKEVSNYYRIILFKREYGQDGVFSDTPLWFESDDVVFGTMETDLLFESENNYHLFSDGLFNGKEYKLKLSFNNSGWSSAYGNEKLTNLRELHVELHSLTKDYYLYLKSREASYSDDLGGILSEPVQIYNNIKGGIGILGCYNTLDYVIPLRRK
jgi:hypothetical protein